MVVSWWIVAFLGSDCVPYKRSTNNKWITIGYIVATCIATKKQTMTYLHNLIVETHEKNYQ